MDKVFMVRPILRTVHGKWLTPLSIVDYSLYFITYNGSFLKSRYPRFLALIKLFYISQCIRLFTSPGRRYGHKGRRPIRTLVDFAIDLTTGMGAGGEYQFTKYSVLRLGCLRCLPSKRTRRSLVSSPVLFGSAQGHACHRDLLSPALTIPGCHAISNRQPVAHWSRIRGRSWFSMCDLWCALNSLYIRYFRCWTGRQIRDARVRSWLMLIAPPDAC